MYVVSKTTLCQLCIAGLDKSAGEASTKMNVMQRQLSALEQALGNDIVTDNVILRIAALSERLNMQESTPTAEESTQATQEPTPTTQQSAPEEGNNPTTRAPEKLKNWATNYDAQEAVLESYALFDAHIVPY